MATVHDYPVTVTWSGGRDGTGTLNLPVGQQSATIAVPTEFQGTGNGTNPEELLAGAVCACYSITFGIIAANRKLPYTHIETTATGEVEQVGMQFNYRKITIRPKITLSADATDEQFAIAEDLAHKADLYCIITNAVRGKVEIAVEPTVTRG